MVPFPTKYTWKVNGDIINWVQRRKDKKLVVDLTKRQEFGVAKEYSNELEGKKKSILGEYKSSVQCTSKNQKVKQKRQVRDAKFGHKVEGAQISSFRLNRSTNMFISPKQNVRLLLFKT
ncbi:hypothetical protein MTR_4g113960 [Medicago truncatula]|uniref:Uncharacterized protein n=1 Tax=Medicago truncatula TaxID=3880 RepID=G7JVC0_MEDTR|nr:hypothetical protein MTR_4g113960 [Medicago truncatula]